MGEKVLPRSYLYVPAHRDDLWAKAILSPADALILDLEDGTPPARREHATALVDGQVNGYDGGAQVCVRVACDDTGLGLLGRLASLRSVSQVFLAKAERVEDVERTAGILADAGSAATICLIIESASGLMNVTDLIAAPRVSRVQLGEADLRASLRIPASARHHHALLGPRTTVVVAAAAAGIDPPTASVSTTYDDLETFRRDTEDLRDLGFFGRTCIHPRQILVVNDVFTPRTDEATAAQSLVDSAPADGGAHAGPDRVMIDEAVLRGARSVLRDVAAYGVRPSGS